MKTYFKILSYGRPHSRYALPYAIYIILHSIFNIAVFMMLVPILETMISKDGALRVVESMPDFEMSKAWLMNIFNYGLYKYFGSSYSLIDFFFGLALTVVVLSLLSNLFRYLAQRTMENLRIHTVQQLRDGLFDKVIRLQAGYFSNERKGDIISKITSDVQVVQYCVTSTLQVFFREPVLITTYMIVLFAMSWKLTLITLAILPFIAIFIGGIVKKLRKASTAGQESFSEMVSLLDESLGAIKTIKGYNATDYVDNKFKSQNSLYSKIQRSIARRQQLASPVSEFLGIMSIAFILIYGGYMIIDGEIDAAIFITFIGIFSQVTRPVKAISDAFGNINQGIAAGERILKLMDTKPEINDKPNAIELKNFHESIEFKDVCFSYEERQVLNNINFTIPKGQTVALVGPSGGGKSTISDMIPRFYDPQKGEILIDGVSITEYTTASIRSKLGIVAQETILFNDTIEGNIRMGNNEATIEQITAAAKVANAHDFIMQTDQGYQTNIGDRGAKLSGGQRQRLSIARAILRNPEILVLDEATSALDTESERLVQDALSELLKGRTSLVIAHRLSTIQHSDKIIVIDGGCIVEEGTHNELMANNGLYSKLIEMQQLN